ncbi:MAG TPA: LLM class flavin-dependent oxidoreductase [Candidatus Binataceae bacterium]|nr:LLM class flavin-dependent oxidoreductase [Candidatus Binataceae bacterium]
MRTGYMLLFQNAHQGMSDAEMVRNEMRIAESTEALGFDTIWSAEHHFDYYSILPDNLQILTYLAGRTSKIHLGSAAVILPWNDPLRVTEKVCMLDALCDGRFILGLGRGLARMEYRIFGIDMNESRERFNESAKMVLKALQTGYIEGDGPFYKQVRTEIRPRPTRAFQGRTYCVAMSPDTAPIAAELGARMMFFVQFSLDKHMPGVELYRESFKKFNKQPAPPPLAIDFTYCDRDAGRAEELARRHIAGYYLSVIKHYEFNDDYHSRLKGYEGYAQAAQLLKETGLEKAAQAYADEQAFGTPQQILDKLEKRRQMLGDFEWNVCSSYAGMPFKDVESSLKLMAKEVLPEIRSWGEDAFEPARASA